MLVTSLQTGHMCLSDVHKIPWNWFALDGRFRPHHGAGSCNWKLPNVQSTRSSPTRAWRVCPLTSPWGTQWGQREGLGEKELLLHVAKTAQRGLHPNTIKTSPFGLGRSTHRTHLKSMSPSVPPEPRYQHRRPSL